MTATRCGIAAAIALAFAAACDRAPDGGEALPEQNLRVDFLWSDHLAVPPPAGTLSPAEVPPAEAVRAAEHAVAGLLEGGWLEAESRLPAVLAAGSAARPALEAALADNGGADPQPPRRALAAFALAALGDPAAAPLLCMHAGDREPEVALFCVRALGDLRVPWTLPRVIHVIGRYFAHPELIVRVEACAAMARFGNAAGVPLAIRVLEEHTSLADPATREWTERPRIAFEKEEALRVVRAFAGEDFGFTPNATAARQEECLARIHEWWSANRERVWRAAPPITDAGLRAKVHELVEGFDVYQISVVDNARFILAGLGPPVLPLLEPSFTDPRLYLRTHVLEVAELVAPLLEADDPRAVTLIATARLRLASDEPPVRAAAARVLGRCPDRGDAAIPALLGALDDADPSVRVATIEALGFTRGDEARAAGAAEPDRVAAALLSIAGAPAGERGADQRAAANLALVRRGRIECRETLLDGLLADDLDQQSCSLDALGALGAPIADFPLGGAAAERATAAEPIRAFFQNS